MFRFTFYTFTISYVLFIIGAYYAFRYNSPKRSVIILSIAFILDTFSTLCVSTGFLTPRLSTGLGSNFHQIPGMIFSVLAFFTFLLSLIPYKKGNIQLHQRAVLFFLIFYYLAGTFWKEAVVQLLAPFKPVIS